VEVVAGVDFSRVDGRATYTFRMGVPGDSSHHARRDPNSDS
jgi:hypothetical protein